MIKLIMALVEIAVAATLISDIVKDIKKGADTDQDDSPDKDER